MPLPQTEKLQIFHLPCTFLHPPQPNSDFVDVLMHPRFGRIMGLAANRDVAEGEEITVNYNYGEDGDGPAWYSEAKKGES